MAAQTSWQHARGAVTGPGSRCVDGAHAALFVDGAAARNSAGSRTETNARAERCEATIDALLTDRGAAVFRVKVFFRRNFLVFYQLK